METSIGSKIKDTAPYRNVFLTLNQNFWDCQPVNPPANLLSFRITDLSYNLRCKPDWIEKLKDSNIRRKWEKEALELELRNDRLAHEQILYCFEEMERWQEAPGYTKNIMVRLESLMGYTKG